MSDTDKPAAGGTPPLVTRKCQCGAWTGFGVVPNRREDMQEWWCWKHYPYKEAPTGPIPTRSNDDRI